MHARVRNRGTLPGEAQEAAPEIHVGAEGRSRSSALQVLGRHREGEFRGPGTRMGCSGAWQV